MNITQYGNYSLPKSFHHHFIWSRETFRNTGRAALTIIPWGPGGQVDNQLVNGRGQETWLLHLGSMLFFLHRTASSYSEQTWFACFWKEKSSPSLVLSHCTSRTFGLCMSGHLVDLLKKTKQNKWDLNVPKHVAQSVFPNVRRGRDH